MVWSFLLLFSRNKCFLAVRINNIKKSHQQSPVTVKIISRRKGVMPEQMSPCTTISRVWIPHCESCPHRSLLGLLGSQRISHLLKFKTKINGTHGLLLWILTDLDQWLETTSFLWLKFYILHRKHIRFLADGVYPFSLIRNWSRLDVVTNAFDPSTLKAQAGGFLWVPGQFGLYSETLSKNRQKKKLKWMENEETNWAVPVFIWWRT